jgi:hypothetical protein
MSGILFLCVIAALGASCGLMMVQMDMERRRQAAEQRASKARRLRFIGLKTEVMVKDIPDNHFHLFLSHVWGTVRRRRRSWMRYKPQAATMCFVLVGRISFGRGKTRCAS